MSEEQKATVYLETSFISYLAGRVSRDILVSAEQEISRVWWSEHSKNYYLFISPLIIKEIRQGDRTTARQRQDLLSDIPALELTEDVLRLAKDLEVKAFPPNAADDALHVATAAVGGMDYILTWNFKHIANAAKRYEIISVCNKAGYECPLICTPLELLDIGARYEK